MVILVAVRMLNYSVTIDLDVAKENIIDKETEIHINKTKTK